MGAGRQLLTAFVISLFRFMYHDSSCCVPEQILLQSLVFWCLLLLGNMALSGSKSLKYFQHYKQDITLVKVLFHWVILKQALQKCFLFLCNFICDYNLNSSTKASEIQYNYGPNMDQILADVELNQLRHWSNFNFSNRFTSLAWECQ